MTTLTKNQKIQKVKVIGNERLTVTIRHDDQCGNGHNTFSITGTLQEGRREVAWGCLHDEVARFFPELRPYLKWHLCSTDGPMHYVANTMYLASDKDCWGKRKGEPKSYSHAVKFGSFPITYALDTKFYKWLQSLENYDLEVMAVHHNSNGHTYAPKYTFLPFSADTWHTCPFNTEQEAMEFLEALQLHTPVFVQIPTAWGEGKEPDLEAARNSAIWPDATLEQLQDKATLEARLPALLDEFKAAVESLGLIY